MVVVVDGRVLVSFVGRIGLFTRVDVEFNRVSPLNEIVDGDEVESRAVKSSNVEFSKKKTKTN